MLLASEANAQVCCQPVCMSVPMARMPITKSYRVQPGFCPQQLVWMIANGVPACDCGPGCGPYGIPPIYSAGNYVLVRTTPEGQQQVEKFLAHLGPYVRQRWHAS